MDILLFATDFSTRSDRAMRRAILLARQEGWDMLVTHVAEPQANVLEGADTDEAARLLRRIARHIEESEGIRCAADPRSGEVADELAASARESGAELMIIGPHRRSIVRDSFRHVTANRIARRTEVPLIAANAIPLGEYRRVLVPTDLGDSSLHASKLARSLPFLKNADLTLLYIFDAAAQEMLGRALVHGTEREDYVRKAEDIARAELDSFASNIGLTHSRRIVRPESGSVSADVQQTAAEEAADLILLSRSNKGTIAEAFLGSVTEGVLRDGKRDVLIVPEASSGE